MNKAIVNMYLKIVEVYREMKEGEDKVAFATEFGVVDKPLTQKRLKQLDCLHDYKADMKEHIENAIIKIVISIKDNLFIIIVLALKNQRDIQQLQK